MRSLLLSSIIFLTISGCDEETKKSSIEWRKLGLDGKTVNEIKLYSDILFVATSDGLYRKNANSGEFSVTGFAGKNVQSLVVFSENHMIVSLVDKSHLEERSLHVTTNQGETWEEIENNFGGDYPEPVFDMVADPGNNSTLYATGWQVVAKSTDQGTTWTPIWAEWGGFATGTDVVEFNAGSNEIWAGGQGAIENGYLLRSSDQMQWDQWNDLVDNPTVVKAITFDPGNPDHTYVGYEGALIRSRDRGTTWETLIDSEENRFFFGVALGETTDRIYTGGWLKRFDDPQPLKIFYSDDDGQSWHEETLASEDFGGIYTMTIEPEDDRDILYLGLYKGGVYQVTVPHAFE